MAQKRGRIVLQRHCMQLRKQCLEEGLLKSCKDFKLNECYESLQESQSELATLYNSNKKGYALQTVEVSDEFLRKFEVNHMLSVSDPFFMMEDDSGTNHSYWREIQDEVNLRRDKWRTNIINTLNNMSTGRSDMTESNTFLVSSRTGFSSDFYVVTYRPKQKVTKKVCVSDGSKKPYMFIVDDESFPISQFSIQGVRSLIGDYFSGSIQLVLPVYIYRWNLTTWVITDCSEILTPTLGQAVESSGTSIMMQSDVASFYTKANDNNMAPSSYSVKNVEIVELIDFSYIKYDVIRTVVQRLISKLYHDNWLPRHHVVFDIIERFAMTKDIDLKLDSLIYALILFLSMYKPNTVTELRESISNHILKQLNIKPTCVQICESGMASINTVMQEQLKIKEPRLLYLDNTYFEFGKRISTFPHLTKIKSKIEYENFYQEIQEPCDEKTHLYTFVMMDLAWSMSNTIKDEYYEIDIIGLLQNLINNGWLNKGCTVVLDITVDTVFSQNVRMCMQNLLQYITKGDIQVVLVSSLQKFYQFGIDKLSGGFAAWFTNTKVNYPSTVLPPIVSTGYWFFVEETENMIEKYVKHVHFNNRLIYDIIQNLCPSYITKVPENTKMVGIDTHIDLDPLEKRIDDCKTAKIVFRPSWGFRHTVATMTYHKTRLSVGASLSIAEIKGIVLCFCPIQHSLEDVSNAYAKSKST